MAIRRIRFGIMGFMIFCAMTMAMNAGAYQFEAGEELHYEVSYMGIKLGKLIVNSEGLVDYQSKKAYKMKAKLDTYDGIPFIDAHTSYETWADKSFTFARLFKGYALLEDKSRELHQILFNYDDNNIKTEKWVHNKLVEEINISTSKKWIDGLTMFYMCRKYINLKRTINVPTINGNDTAYTKLNFHGRKDEVEIDAADDKIKTVYMNGKAGWEGVYGVTGEFKAWFSDDDARVPIKAEMNLYVGNVDIELVKWKKKNWSPPKAE